MKGRKEGRKEGKKERRKERESVTTKKKLKTDMWVQSK